MSSNPKVSVVIPVYNTAAYLRQCLDSVVGQTLRDIEIICVDDGSTDESLSILREYEQRDDRITVLTQKNQYAGVARNSGMAIARGEYLVFWDSDDYFDPRALSRMYRQIRRDKADICVCGGKQYYEERELEVRTDEYLVPSRVPRQLPFNRLSHPDIVMTFTTVMIWNKMYRRAFLEKYQIRFREVRNGNDVYFSASALCMAEGITVVPGHLVAYRIGRKDSLVSTLGKSPVSPLLEWTAFYEDYRDIPGFPERSYANKVIGVVRHSFRSLSNWCAYEACFGFLREGGLSGLGIRERPTGYYVDWADDFLAHLLRDSPEDFLAFLSFEGYRSLEYEVARRKKLGKMALCRFARAIASPSRTIKRLLGA